MLIINWRANNVRLHLNENVIKFWVFSEILKLFIVNIEVTWLDVLLPLLHETPHDRLSLWTKKVEFVLYST